jgi:hypothetical protein
MVYELRDFLSEHIYTCFFTNFCFEHNGSRLNEYQELAELDLSSNPKIFMRPATYDDKTARAHIKRFVDILDKAPVLTNNLNKVEPAKPRSRSASAASEDLKAPEASQDDKLKKSYEELMKIIQAHEGDEIKVPEKEKITQASQILNELFLNPISKSSLNRLKKVKCLDSIKFDKANPISADRKVQGDLFYLNVRTLDSASEFGITCTANGFYHNRSIGQSFNPAPNTTNPCFSYSLVGCIHQMSASFGKNLEVYLNSILKTDPYFLTALPQVTNSWISRDQQNGASVCQDENLGQTIVPLYGLDPKQLRDWNEEF